MTKHALWIAIACLAACTGGESHFERQPASVVQVAHACDAGFGWSFRCDPDNAPTEEEAYAECVADPRWPLLWSEAVESMRRCFETLSCEEIDDVCFDHIFEDLELDPYQDDLVLECLDATTACSLRDDDCFLLPVYHDEVRARTASCLAEDCATLADCLANPQG